MHRQTEIIIIAIKLRLMPCPADKLIHRLEFQIASLEEIVKNFHSETDTLGSYTGLPSDEKNPLQDADDL